MLDPLLDDIFAYTLALLFLVSGWTKWHDHERFTLILNDYQVTPRGWSTSLAFIVPGVECLTACLLWFSSTRRVGALLCAVLLAAYAVAIAINLRRGRRNFDCGCGLGTRRQAIAAWMIPRNVALALIASSVTLGRAHRAFELADYMSLVGGVGVSAILYAAFNTLLASTRSAAINEAGL